MSAKILKKKLKLGKLKEIINCPITIITQTNLLESKFENIFLNNVYKNDFKSLKTSSRFLKNYLQKKKLLTESLSTNNIRIFYIGKSAIFKKKVKNFLTLLNEKNFNNFLFLLLLGNSLTLKISNFFFNFFFNTGVKSFLFKFISKVQKFLVIFVFNYKVNNGI